MWAGGGVLGRNFEDSEFIFKILPEGLFAGEALSVDDGHQVASPKKDAWIPDSIESDPRVYCSMSEKLNSGKIPGQKYF